MPDDFVADYLWLSLACGEYGFNNPGRGDRPAILGSAIEAPLIGFKGASTCSINRTALQGQLDDPRFLEANYFLGLSAPSGKIGPAVRPESPIWKRRMRVSATRTHGGKTGRR